MCGIFGVIRDASQTATQKTVTGLQRLEYRGYDSWGVAVWQNGQQPKIFIYKQVGKLDNIPDLPESSITIGHTRWATHGGVTQVNAHPHAASDESFSVVHNGVVENFSDLKNQLMVDGYQFTSQTDTEVIVRLIEKCRTMESDFVSSVRSAFLQLHGRNTFVVLTREGKVLAIRNGSPLIVGRNTIDGTIFLSSDTLSFADQVQEILVVENQHVVVIDGTSLELIDIVANQKVEVNFEPLQLMAYQIDKQGYQHFMLKEIHESGAVIRAVWEQDQDHLIHAGELIQSAQRVFTIGSGTAGIAASQIAYYLRQQAGIFATSLVGGNANEYLRFLNPRDVIIAPSQSGETADVLEILEQAKNKGAKIISYVNMPGSSMTRIADISFLANAGPEVCVMSTKVFISQLAWGYLLSMTIAGKYQQAENELRITTEAIDQFLKNPELLQPIENLATQLKTSPHIFLLGKGQNYAITCEGMVKIVEGSYIHAHAIPAGDLKHYAITLMEKGVPVIVAIADDAVRQDVMTAGQEVQARGATVIGVGASEEPMFDQFLQAPKAPLADIANVIPLQLLAYYLSVQLGHDVDHPRNIAKSVTVK